MKKYLWKTFLLLYFVVLIAHTVELGIGVKSLPFFALGFIIAIVSHRTSHVISLLFLVAHMTIEAIEYASVGFALTTAILFWVLVHIAMDYTFLWGEVKRHFFAVRYQMWGAIALGLVCVYTFVPKVIGAVTEHSSILELIVLGGVMGCVLSHILPHKHHV